MRRNAGAAIGLSAFVFLFPSSNLAMAEKLYPYYTKHCWTRYDPPVSAILSADKEGVLTWNGTPVDWETIQNYLADLPKAMDRDSFENFSMTVVETIPHRKEILDALAKDGLTFHQCEPMMIGIP